MKGRRDEREKKKGKEAVCGLWAGVCCFFASEGTVCQA